MEGVSEEVDSFAFQDCKSDIFHEILYSNNKVRFVYINFSPVFVVGTKTSKPALFVWSKQNVASLLGICTFPINLKPFSSLWTGCFKKSLECAWQCQIWQEH